MNTPEAVQKLKANLQNIIVREENFLGQVALEVKKENLIKVLSFLKQSIEPGYEVLMDLTGVDYIKPVKQTKVIYFLHNPTTFERIRVFVLAGRNEALPSVVRLWPGANWYERELFDLFGIKFDGHPDLKRLLMPDDWEGHPLRKDYALTEEAVEFKNGVEPKIPSEIIHIKRDQKFIPLGQTEVN